MRDWVELGCAQSGVDGGQTETGGGQEVAAFHAKQPIRPRPLEANAKMMR